MHSEGDRNRTVTATEPPEDGAGDPFPQRPASGSACQYCGQAHPGGRFVVGCPGPRLRNGLYSALVRAGELPSQAEAIAALAERQGEIEADLGGAQALSRVHRDAIRDLLRMELVGEFLFERLVREGPLTGKGRTRAALNAYLAVADRLHRLRHMVGVARVPRSIPTLADALAAVGLDDEGRRA